MSCFVKQCPDTAVTVRDLDPDKVGGKFSYSYEVGLCQSHAAAIDSGADWLCQRPEGGVGGWEVLVGEQIKDLNRYVFQAAPTSIKSDSSSERDSGVIPSSRKVSIEAHQIGSPEPSTTLDLYLDANQARDLIKLLEFFIQIDEKRKRK